MFCIHHNDLDGRAAARVVALVEWNFNPDRYFEADYVKEIPLDKISQDEKVYIVDYSFTEETVETLRKILEITKNVVWIDHHDSSEKLVEKYPELQVAGTNINTTVSGAALTYMVLHNAWYQDIPMYLKYISDYDCWYFKYGRKTEYFKCYMDTRDYRPFAEVWDLLEKASDKVLDSIISQGEIIRRYLDNIYKEILDNFSYVANVEDADGIYHEALVVNYEGNSWVFGDMFNTFDICILWNFDGKNYRYSLYSHDSKVDVSKIAEKYSGGGHTGAAGCISGERIW